MPTELRKPLVRRIGSLVVRLTAEGVAIRGFRKKTWRRMSWARLAANVNDTDVRLIEAGEEEAGQRILARLRAAGPAIPPLDRSSLPP
jgi:hypothetical protein